MSRGQGVARLHVYVGAVAVLAGCVLAASLSALDLSGLPRWGWSGALFLGLYVLALLFPLRLPGRRDSGEFTASATFAYALLLAVPLPAALLSIAVGTAVGTAVGVRRRKRTMPWVRLLFNVAQATLAFAVGGVVLAAAGAGPDTASTMPPMVLVALLPSGLALYGVNIALTSWAIALDQHLRPRTVVMRYLAPFGLVTHVLLLAFAPVFVVVWQHSYLLVPLLLVAVAATYRSTHAAVAGKHDSRHDSLTGLPNRRVFDERLAELMAAGRGASFSVMLMDLDRFKQVNDALGHQLGDQLLVEVAARLIDLPDVDTVARVGGDEFAFLVRGRRGSDELRSLAQGIVELVTEPYVIQELPLQVGASIGVATYPEHGRGATMLLRRADTAMYSAKGTSDGVRLALATDERRAPGRASLVGDLSSALADGQLRLDYQPQLELATGRVVGLEALLRWDHPQHGAIVPERYIDTVEYTELLPALTRYVIQRALRDARHRTLVELDLPMSVNVSARDLLDRRLATDIAELLDRYDTTPSRLTLEITEAALRADRDRAAMVTSELVELGVGLSIDDFGTGSSSLTTLRDLTVTEVKIERSFVTSMAGSRAGTRIVQAMIELGHDLELRVVAEGIEHPAELGELERLGCRVGQGYLLCRPLPSSELIDWLAGRSEPLATTPRPVASTPSAGPRTEASLGHATAAVSLGAQARSLRDARRP